MTKNELNFTLHRYLQMRTPKLRSKILLPTIQCIFLLYACLCSISRITDNRHHWWDVLAGAKIGIIFAVLVVNKYKIKSIQYWFRLLNVQFTFSVYSCAKISKQRRYPVLSPCYKMAIQLIIDIPACVVFYPNEPKMNWI